MTSNKNNNKSMFLYTALIFLVAVILIIISFFGQTNLESKQPLTEEAEPTALIGEGITQKASILSQENVKLINDNISLKEEISSKEEVISSLGEENSNLKSAVSNYGLLTSIYKYICEEKTEEAIQALNAIDYDSLTDEQKIVYDDLKNILG